MPIVQKVMARSLSPENVISSDSSAETNMENTTPRRISVLVAREWSRAKARARRTTRERNAESIAAPAVPPKGRNGMDTPLRIASAAPSDAPELTPHDEPSASGLRSSPCMAQPPSASIAPTSATHSTRGRRVYRMMATADPLGCSQPAMARKMISAVSWKGTLTLPTPMHRISVSTVSSANSRCSRR